MKKVLLLFSFLLSVCFFCTVEQGNFSALKASSVSSLEYKDLSPYREKLSSSVNFALPPSYIIDFDLDSPTFNFINDQLVEVTGNVLLNDGTGIPAGFGYKITFTITGGPIGSTPINYLNKSNTGPAIGTAASKFDTNTMNVRTFGGSSALVFAFKGRDGNTTDDYTYLRDPSSNMRFTLELDNQLEFKNSTYILGDMDYSLEADRDPCFGPSDLNDYNCRFTYIDQIEVISGAGNNTYTFPDAPRIKQDGPDKFYANFPDANNNKKIDLEDDGRVPGTDNNGNIIISNSGNIGKQIIFDYNDPGYGREDDPDGYHDYDSYNQVMSFMTGMTFDAVACTMSDIEVDIQSDAYPTTALSATATVADGSSLTYQWQSSTTSCTEGFVDIVDATTATYTPADLEVATFFRVIMKELDIAGVEACTQISPCISLGKIGGCIHEDVDRDGSKDTEDVAIGGIPISLYNCDNLKEPIATTLTGEDGKYCFASLISGDYTILVEPPTDYLFSNNSSIKNTGFSDCIPLEEGEEMEDCDILLGICHEFDTSLEETTILKGDEVCIKINQAGDYIWDSPTTASVACRNCEETCLFPTETTIYTATWDNQEDYTCPHSKELAVEVLTCSMTDIALDIQSMEYPNHLLTVSLDTAADRTLTYQWQSSTLSCTEGFTDIPDAIATTYAPTNLTVATFFRVMITEYGIGREICTLPSPCIGLGKIGGCLTEDTNRDGEDNDGAIPLANIPVTIYACSDVGTPISTVLTDELGKYCFAALVEGEYLLSMAPPVEFKLPQFGSPLGNFNANGGFSDCISLDGGETSETCIGLGPCMPIDVSTTEETIIRGEEVCVEVTGAGAYVWTPAEPITQEDNIFKIKPENSTTYTVKSEGYYTCEDEASVQINVWTSQSLIKAPCTCVGTDQFQDEIRILAVTANERWALIAENGLDVGVGATPVYTGTHYSGMSIYTLPVAHSSGVGYTAQFTNGTDTLAVKNICFADQSCNKPPDITNVDPEGTPGIPTPPICTHIMNVSETTPAIDTIQNCMEGCDFRTEGTDKYTLYTDTIARNNIHTICPQDQWHTVKITFSEFDIAAGDTLFIHEGRDTFGTEIAKWSGSSVSLTGGWIAANCDPSANLSGCLTFNFKTNGDNGKGLGWRSKATCEARAAQIICPDRNGVSVVGTSNKNNRDLSSLNTALVACTNTTAINIPLPEFVGCAVNTPASGGTSLISPPFFLEVLHDGNRIGIFDSLGIAGATTFAIPTLNNVQAGVHSVTYILHFDMDGDGNPNDGQLVEKDRVTCSYIVKDAVDLVGNDNIVVALGDDCWTDIGLDDVLEGYENLVDGATLKAAYLLTINGTASNNGDYSNMDEEVIVQVGQTGTFDYIARDACGNVVGGTITVVDYQGPVCPGPQIIHQLCAAPPVAAAPAFKDCNGEVVETSHDEIAYGTCGLFSQAEVNTLMDHFDANTFVLDAIDPTLGFRFNSLTAVGANVNNITVRTWKATDDLGNTTENCPQIYINYRPTTINMPNLAVLPVQCGEATTPARLNALKNGDGSRRFTKQNTAPWYTVTLPDGRTITDFILSSEEHAICNYLTDYKDQAVETCGQGKKIIRTWTVLDWCGANTMPSAPFTQVIKVEDTTEPALTEGPSATTHSSEHFDCRTDITLEGATWTDACAEVVAYRTELRQYIDPDDDGDFKEHLATAPILWRNNENGGTFNTIETGTYWVLYYAMDECENETSRLVTTQDQTDWTDIPANVHVTTVTVVDDVKPQAQCEDLINVSLGSNWGKLDVKDVDEGSYDNCGITSMAISLSAAGPFMETLTLDCEIVDIHTNLEVHLQVTDAAGNTNTCWGTIQLEDKIPPVCEAPADVTVNCTDKDIHYADLFTTEGITDITGTPMMAQLNELFGAPTCFDNLTCGDLVRSQSIEVAKGNCGEFTIYRDFSATDWRPNTSSTVRQKITVQYVPDWKVTFPSDAEVVCTIGGGDALPTYGEEDLIIESGFCDQISIEVDTREFVAQDGACRKIEVTYHVINWCAYEAGQAAVAVGRNAAGGAMATAENGAYVSYTRVIQLVDKVAPVVTIDDPDLCIYGGENGTCSGTATWTAWADDCVEEEEITFVGKVYEVSESGSRTLVAESNGPEITTEIFNKSVYVAEFWAYDGCGNSGGAATSPRTAWDCKQPTPYALNGVVISLMPTGMVAVWASDLDQGSFDNCSPIEALDLRLRKVGAGAPTTLSEVQDLPTSLTFDCLELGTQHVELYVIDREGNYDFVTTYVLIQDNLGACTSPPESINTGQVAGTITNVAGEFVENVTISVNGGMASIMSTEDNGRYTFTLPTDEDYTVTPEKNVNPLNGVSTFDLVLISKHILGIQPFDNPYQYIAGDINKSGSITAFDMVQLRQLILNITSEFPNNTSWRFVDAAHQFGATPLVDNFNEFVSINDFEFDRMNLDFVAVKVGDVNGNAQADNLVAATSRTSQEVFTIQVADRKVKAGETYTIGFTTTQLATIQGYQFTLNYDDLQLQQIKKGLMTSEHFGIQQKENGFITASWHQVTPSQKATTTLFSIEFKASNDGQLSELLNLESQPTLAEAYDIAGNLLNVQFEFITPIEEQPMELFQNEPNPFREQTTIGFYLPGDSEVELLLRDETGRVLLTIQENSKKGFNQIQLSDQQLPQGFIFYQLNTRFGSQTKKMLGVK